MSKSPSTFHVVMLLWFIAVTQVAVSQSVRQSQDKLSEPQFLSSYHANITRLSACSTEVVEAIVFPHTSGIPWTRQVPVLEGQTIRATSVTVKQSGIRKNFSLSSDNHITFQTPQTKKAVEFELSYIIENEVVGYTRSCYRTTDSADFNVGRVPNAKYVLLSWSLGKWEKKVNVMNVTFRTMNENAQLRFANSENRGEPQTELKVSKLDVRSPILFHVLEISIARNMSDRQLEDFNLSSSVGGVLIIGSIAFFFVSIFVCARACSDTSRAEGGEGSASGGGGNGASAAVAAGAAAVAVAAGGVGGGGGC